MITAVVLQAALAAALGAAGLVELAASLPPRRTPRRTRRGPWLALLAALGRAAAPPRPPADLGARLAAAGLDGRISIADAMAAKAGAALAALPLAAWLGAALPGRSGTAVLLALPAAGFLLPDQVLRRRARARAAQAALELPDVLDLLRVAVDAGLPPDRALQEVAHRHRGLVAAELGAVAARTALGEPREQALDRLGRRLPVPEVLALAAVLRRAARHGAPPGEALAALAADARAARARELRDRAARAAPKIQLVVALLLVPATLLLVAAGLIEGLT